MHFSKKIKSIMVALLVILATVSLTAFSNDDEDRGDPQARKPRGPAGSKRILESWYHQFTIGLVANSEIDGISFETDIAVALDFLRFYFPLNSKAILGFGINGTGHTNDGSDAQLNLYLYSASIQYYFRSIGDGFFLRGDVGGSKGAVSNDSGGLEAASNWGFGYLVGVGYALPISSETSLLFYGTFRSLGIEGNTFSDVSFQVGWLW